ncbi:sporamin B-like [Ipomoea triloba]|uniref:sporamin B-like n=1 Tax=Ipomoea triloba TaxID=35885 RepID=UPI00125D0A0A|nr:sporamin B-like [Ipomoea triloba]
MKTLIIALFLFLLPNPTHSTFNNNNPIRLPTANNNVTVTSDVTPVLDTDGDAVWAGRNYYITSVDIRGAPAGGVHLPPLRSTICPTRVIVSPPSTDGDRIRIWRSDFTISAIFPSTFHYFTFTDPAWGHCVNRVSWWIQYGHPSGQYFLNAGLFSLSNAGRFMIEAVQDQFLPDRNIYKLLFCPRGICYNVGRQIDNLGVMRLALTDDSPFYFMIKKA